MSGDSEAPATGSIRKYRNIYTATNIAAPFIGIRGSSMMFPVPVA